MALRSGVLVSESVRIDDPGDLLDLVPPDAATTLYFAYPEDGTTIAAAGVGAEIRTAGPGRFRRAAAAARALLGAVEHAGGGPGPLLLGGFAFADEEPADPRWAGFPALRLVLPERTWLRRAGEAWAIRTTWRAGAPPEHCLDRANGDGTDVAVLADARAGASHRALGPAADPDAGRARWRAMVEAALGAIDAGRLRKVVLARAREGACAADADPRPMVAALRDARPSCVTFWVRQGGASFVGSSPEVLVRLGGERMTATALAGSACRGNEPADDAARARALLGCAKNAAEHAFVADDVRAALARVCDDVRVDAARVVRRLPEALHLATVFVGIPRPGADLLEAVRALHPTSAVCGAPRASARRMIAALEPERGWYGGGVGWLDVHGEGTFAVALRCGLLRGGRATIWAGAGIVAGSNPRAEYDETEAKMEAMARVLDADGGAAGDGVGGGRARGTRARDPGAGVPAVGVDG